MALNRFAVFVVPFLGRAFTKTTVYYSVAVTWLIVLCIFAIKANLNIETHSKWSIADFFIRSDPAATVIILIGYIVPLTILLIYVLIYAYIRKRRSALDSAKVQDKNDIALLWQGFVIAVSLIIFRTINTFAPRVEAVMWIQWLMNIIRGMTSIVNHTLNPILFLTTNKTVSAVC
ncbi:hypothetical protein OESDEN_04574 [Oesophagostomum dentatum]|uniref:G-protein coupled receptors family 1 profile domain-containing protein n=1 Tax=Oesophagostomum dentatum TaxID=61180 RepID=A0A0B1TI33_OESDE|nr:hypothetical protein OESDEN_04574 [Oesophagostomum dentatum]